jgi:hypothetical protein
MRPVIGALSCGVVAEIATAEASNWCSKLRGRSPLREGIVVIELVGQCRVSPDLAALGIYMVLGVFRTF